MFADFIESLRHSPPGLFNPWFHRDRENDAGSDAPRIRREQLLRYLEERAGRAEILLVAEALGYQGGHFSGIAMTSERILLGHQNQKYGISPESVFRGIRPRRTSKEELNLKGMSEPTATIVWGALTELGINPYSVVLWNALPWHPYKKEKGMLSNRTPKSSEMELGLRHLRSFISLFENTKLVAVGRKCEESLTELGVPFTGVRHPANGGAPGFRMQLAEIHARRKGFIS
ncbi:MAG: uracil-DNA glycosylase [Balneolaceae bacterium]|nr:MAG: uracil-DNA glycosylase [Balneolaceae bacterium]